MAIHVALQHQTRYRYDRLVSLSPHVVRLRPAPHCRTPILSYSLKVEPQKHFLNWQQDPYGNYLARLVFPEHDARARRRRRSGRRDDGRSTRSTSSSSRRPSSSRSPTTPWLAKELRAVSRSGCRPGRGSRRSSTASTARRAADDRLPRRAQSAAVARRSSYVIRLEPGVQTPEETLDARHAARAATPRGCWCRSLRHLGLAARFVSGYLIQLDADVKPLDGPRGPTPTSPTCTPGPRCICPAPAGSASTRRPGLLAGEGHIPLAAHARSVSAPRRSPAQSTTCEVDVRATR